MRDETPAHQTRKGLLASVTGKAKEVAGAVLGNDSLAAEGQLQQAEAVDRKEASADKQQLAANLERQRVQHEADVEREADRLASQADLPQS